MIFLPAWSPESDKIAFAGYDRDIDRFDLFMMNPDGTQMERLTIRSGDNEHPSWSPNGQMIVFESNRTAGRDVKGLYTRQRAGEISGLTGVDDPYEAPAVPDARIEAHTLTVAQSAAAVHALLVERGLA